MCKLQKRLEERNCQLEASAFAADKVYFSIYQLNLVTKSCNVMVFHENFGTYLL